ncbi:metallo-beta-lactamase superfamily protein [Ruminiclostridium sufflavum DSM 19573]|uniref:Metallo-beta-lactamase superfamily protein n=1 Tax=Ruminiclostridium sufflavum DSM 19573 TaxID=1121337 RepID=A0A318XK66_9FIRM|nr:MBL fold metallo-hydrolase [Ruminiclostridium sufflavum]PYG87751.1 metallo-beta-lactamase superfamily protein [Ruminiclostridium sufflavum DSM 19573]
MSIELQVRKAAKGDCIWVRFGKETKGNIIIDSGTAAKAKEFSDIIETVRERNEAVDLLVLTHIDDDHIGGFKKYIAKNDCKIIKEVWFHGSGVNAYEGITPHSPKNAVQLSDIMKKKKMNVNNEVFKGCKRDINGAKLTVLTPEIDAVLRVGALLDDAAAGIKPHSEGIHNQDLDWLYENDKYTRDDSLTNAASISFVFCYEGKRLAFLGDAHAEDIIKSKEELFKGVNMDMVKLPHHGSSHNNPEELIKCLACGNLIISANQPADKNTIARIVHSTEKCTIYCNYTWWEGIGYFTEEDAKEYIDKEKLIIKEVEAKKAIFADEGKDIWILRKS